MILAMFLFQTFSVLQLAVFQVRVSRRQCFLFKGGGFPALHCSEALFQDEYSDRGLVLGIFLHSRASCTYSFNVQRSDLYFSVGYSEYHPSHNLSKVRWTDWLSVHWSARRAFWLSFGTFMRALLRAPAVRVAFLSRLVAHSSSSWRPS